MVLFVSGMKGELFGPMICAIAAPADSSIPIMASAATAAAAKIAKNLESMQQKRQTGF
jgi:hypothetical protein